MFIDVYNACYNIFLHEIIVFLFIDISLNATQKIIKKCYQGQNWLRFLSKIIKYYKILRPTCIHITAVSSHFKVQNRKFKIINK